MADFGYTIWILILPLVTFVILGLFGMRLKGRMAGLTGTASLAVITALSYTAAISYFTGSGLVDGVYQKIIPFNSVWLNLTDQLHIDIGLLLDPISVMMLVVISTVSFMVHIYSLGYMKGEKGFERYYAFLSLFTFAMLGVSSYLLIGFYYDRPSAVAAGKKAFIVTRFADMGFLVGILILSFTTKTFDFVSLTSLDGPAITSTGGAVFLGMSLMTWSMLLIFIGGAGKSAMFPLHIWLPDAMEGPTPVSALIHAAT
ncbi:MAG: NADH-quinone oxidoreductase subunit L, partial [Bacteroidales bacterium]|nr:NADH-quinone oxidoreductase subunit L [Bacteroidales bacterium]